jgi:hypothetical protein
MSVEIMKDEKSGQQIMFCNTTDWAFGPVFSDDESAEGFLAWLRVDPRPLTDAELSQKVADWRAAKPRWQCQDCDTKLKCPVDDCPECGSDDIELIIPKEVSDDVDSNMRGLRAGGLL